MKLTFYFLLFLLSLATAKAGGIAVAPHTLSIAATEHDPAEKQIIIYNLNEADSEFSLAALNNAQYLEIIPSKGVLNGNEAKPIIIRLNPQLAPGTYAAEILAELKDTNSSGIELKMGTKLKVLITVKPQILYDSGVNKGPLLTAGIVAIGLLVFKALR